MYRADVPDQGVADGGVVNQPLHRLANFGFGQNGVFLVQADVVQRAFRRRGGFDVFVAAKGCQMFRRQIAGDVHIAFFKLQALARRLLDVPVNHPRHSGFFAVVVVVALQRHDFIGAPLAQLQRAGACVVGPEPGMTQVAVHFVRHEQFFVDNRGNARRQAVIDKGRRVSFVGFEDQREGAGLPDLVLHVVFGQTELAQNESGRLVEQNGALQGKHHVFSRQRVARRKFKTRFEFKTIGLAVGCHRPGFGEVGNQGGRIIHVVAKQPVIGIAHDFGCGNLKGFGRVHRDDVVHRPGDHQRVLRRGRRGALENQQGCRSGGAQQAAANEAVDVFQDETLADQ